MSVGLKVTLIIFALIVIVGIVHYGVRSLRNWKYLDDSNPHGYSLDFYEESDAFPKPPGCLAKLIAGRPADTSRFSVGSPISADQIEVVLTEANWRDLSGLDISSLPTSPTVVRIVIIRRDEQCFVSVFGDCNLDLSAVEVADLGVQFQSLKNKERTGLCALGEFHAVEGINSITAARLCGRVMSRTLGKNAQIRIIVPWD